MLCTLATRWMVRYRFASARKRMATFRLTSIPPPSFSEVSMPPHDNHIESFFNCAHALHCTGVLILSPHSALLSRGFSAIASALRRCMGDGGREARRDLCPAGRLHTHLQVESPPRATASCVRRAVSARPAKPQLWRRGWQRDARSGIRAAAQGVRRRRHRRRGVREASDALAEMKSGPVVG